MDWHDLHAENTGVGKEEMEGSEDEIGGREAQPLTISASDDTSACRDSSRAEVLFSIASCLASRGARASRTAFSTRLSGRSSTVSDD